jgi:hypothetical protein
MAEEIRFRRPSGGASACRAVARAEQPGLGESRHERAMKLDWFLSRGLTLGAVEIRPSPSPNGTPLSDHDTIVARI